MTRIFEVIEKAKILQRTPHEEIENHLAVCEQLYSELDKAIEDENNPQVLEQCILEDPLICWNIPVSHRIKLLRKARSLGCNSRDFLFDYSNYMSLVLDPGPEHDDAVAILAKLKNETSG